MISSASVYLGNSIELITGTHIQTRGGGHRHEIQIRAGQQSDIDGIGHRAMIRHRRIINACDMSRHNNLGVNATHVQTNGGTSSRGQRGTLSFNDPSVLDVLVAETIEVSVQSNNASLTSAQLRSIELQVATQLVNRELSRSLATTLGSGHRIDTRNRSSQGVLLLIQL